MASGMWSGHLESYDDSYFDRNDKCTGGEREKENVKQDERRWL